MKIKKEDFGLYFALGLVGAGMGLLVGAYVASRRQRGPLLSYLSEDVEEWDEEAEKAADKTLQKISRKKNRVKKGQIKARPFSDVVTLDELDAFTRKYNPTAIQIEMVKSGVVTLDELEDMMMKEELAKHKAPYDYTQPYLDEDEKPELSDLSKLPEEEGVIDDRYQILQEPPKNKHKKSLRVVYFDAEDGKFHTITRQKRPVPVASIKEFITEETWEVLLPYMVSGFAPLFVDDLKTAKWYRFELVPEDLEDSSEDDASN
jgi:hypothetical protein